MVMYDLALPMLATGDFDTESQCRLATLAEAVGYDLVFFSETWGREAFARLGYLAAHTDRIQLGTGIIPIHSRSPALIGQAAATLDELTGGRAVLSLGLSGPHVIENWHGVEFKPALRRQRETVEILRKVLSGKVVEYHGRVFDLEQFRLRFEPPRSNVPLYVAAQGETNVELTGGFADGWMPNRVPRSALPDLRTHANRGARLQERDPAAVDTMLYVATCVLEDGERARTRVREMIAFYVGAMGEYHYNAIANHGFRETADRIRDHWQDSDRDAARSAVSDALLDEIAIAGTPNEVEELFETYDDVADTLVTLPPTTATQAEIEETVETIGNYLR